MGIGLLLPEVFEAVPKILHDVVDAVSIAWYVGSKSKRPATTDTDMSARHFAQAVAELVNVAMEGRGDLASLQVRDSTIKKVMQDAREKAERFGKGDAGGKEVNLLVSEPLKRLALSARFLSMIM